MAPQSESEAIAKNARHADAERDLRPFLIACCVFFIALEALGFVLTRNLANSPDFRAFYAAGVLFRHNASHLFDIAAQKQVQDTLISPAATALPFYHPSYEALLFAPLSFLPFRAAYLLSIGLNVLLLGAVLHVSRPLFFRAIPFLQPRPGLLFFLFAPVILAILHGQDSILFLLIGAYVWRLLEGENDVAAGAFLALGLFRLQLALPLAALLALRRGKKFTLAFLIASAGVALLSFAITGPHGTLDFLRILRGASLSADQSSSVQSTMGIHPLAAPNLAGLLAALGTATLSAHAAFTLSVSLSVLVFIAAAIRVRNATSLSSAFAWAVVCSLLVSQHANPHDATILLLPIALLDARIDRYVLTLIYYLPAVLLLFLGPNTYWVLAIPMLGLMCLPAAKRDLLQPLDS